MRKESPSLTNQWDISSGQLWVKKIVVWKTAVFGVPNLTDVMTGSTLLFRSCRTTLEFLSKKSRSLGKQL